jgi:hypothetical protein
MEGKKYGGNSIIVEMKNQFFKYKIRLKKALKITVGILCCGKG